MRIIQLQVVLRVPEEGDTGMDYSPENMRYCTERALEESPEMEWMNTEVKLVMLVSSEREG